ncbi:hypothetical protein [Sphaerisporangium perillae]|uniref:hypothetical protein n=1 Tax=Sphaerisporangium perillae TaxID=2935860 RepID=UPI00200CC2C5|nr:hypothetical protein [Sphaerisporangium perillae]
MAWLIPDVQGTAQVLGAQAAVGAGEDGENLLVGGRERLLAAVGLVLLLVLSSSDLEQGLPGELQAGTSCWVSSNREDNSAIPARSRSTSAWASCSRWSRCRSSSSGTTGPLHAARPSNDADRQVMVAVPVSRRVMLSVIDQ